MDLRRIPETNSTALPAPSAHDGNMAARVQAFDWSKTPLGAMDRWPQALRTAVGICLSSRFPMFVWWGPSLVNIYNDAYAPILGKRHPDGLGRSAPDVWHEVWPVIGPQVDAVLTRREPSWHYRVPLVVERNGYPEEAFFTWSHSPIPDERGNVGGVLCVVTEETASVRFEHALRAAEAHQRVVLGGLAEGVTFHDAAGFIQFANATAERILGLSVDQMRGLDSFDPRWRAVTEAGEPFPPEQHPPQAVIRTGQPVRDLEFGIHRGDGSLIWVSANAIPLRDEPGGPITGVVCSFHDVTGRRRADEARRMSEYRFQRMVEHSPLSTQLFWPDGRTRQINAAFTRLFGITLDQLRDYNILHDPQLVATGIMPLMRRAFAGEAVVIDPIPYAPDRGAFIGQTRWAGAHVYPVLDDAGRVEEVVLVHTDVTEQKQGEQALRASEESYRLFFESVGVGKGELDGTTLRFVRVNRKLCQIMGYSADELLALTPGDLTHPDDRGRDATAFARLRAGLADSYEVEKRNVRKDGTVVWVHVTLTAHRAPDGSPRFLGAVQDVTERKRAEARDQFLLALEEAVRPLVEPLEITTTCARLLAEHLDADRCAFADVEADEDTFNLSGDYNRGVPSIVGRYRFADFGAEVLRLMRADEPYVVEDVDTHQPSVGDLTYYRQTLIRAVICVPLHKAGRFVAAMAVHQKTPRRWRPDEVDLVRHVAGRCWESIERARVERTLRQSEERLAFSVEAAELGTFYCPMPMGEIVWNQKCKEHFWLPPDAIVDFERFYAIIHPDDREATRRAVDQAVFDHELYDVQYRTVAPDGRTRWVRAKGRAYYDADGRPTRFDGVTLDVTDQKRFEADREQLLESERAARAEAERQGRLKDEFVSTLSHELRTPLNAILGYAQVLRISRTLDDDTAEGLAVIERNARVQAQIVDDILDVQRIVSGKLRIDVQRVDLPAVIAAALETCKPSADAKGINLVRLLDPRAGPVNGDPGRLQQCVWNLVANSIKFSPRGARVQVVLQRVNSHVEIVVSDTGQGIAPEFLPHVFERFRQADGSTTRRAGGLGLGLSIVKSLVELHGGTVAAQSAGVGRGATFTISLPVVPVDPTPSPAGRYHPTSPRVAPSVSYQQFSLKGVTVLAVDDEPDAREFVRRLLEECGASVVMAGSAEEAIALLDGGTPADLILSDVGMPDVDGYELIEQIRKRDPAQGGDLPAVALTAYARSEDRTRAMVAGFTGHVSKPVEPAELVATVAALARRKSS